MLATENTYSIITGASKYRFRRVLYIAMFWTVIDIIVQLLNDYMAEHDILSLLLRSSLVFVMSLIMGYLFVFTLKSIFRKSPLWINFMAKTIILLFAAFAMTFIANFVERSFILGMSSGDALTTFFTETFQLSWIIRQNIYWIVLFIVTQLYIEINDKYSPGVFMDIITGKYMNPTIETRIVMFIDLKDSTPIAEKLGHQQYFLFIREFIFHISMAIIEQGGIIYQYVGDEIVVSWLYSRKNTRKCMDAVIESRRNIQKYSNRFRRQYGIIPEFRVGIHVGEVTIGEIGVIKKDLAMSGDTMNTTARIRSACNELNQKFIVSKEFMESSDLKDWQAESLGVVELKGKTSGLELFSLKI